MIPPLKPGDPVDQAISWIEELRCNQLPVIENGKFIGLVSEDLIMDSNNIEFKVKDLPLIGKDCHVEENTHFYDIIKVAGNHSVQTIAVTRDNLEYVGAITVSDIVTAFAQSASIQIPGGIIVLSMEMRDYSLSEISRLIEENDAKILSSSIKEDPNDPSKIKVTLKINKVDLSRIIATLERFNYRIIARFQESKVTDSEKEKLDMLFRFLDI